MRTHSQSCPCTDHRHVQSQSLAESRNRRVSFRDPGNKESAAEGENPLAKPSVNDLKTWLEYQAAQLGTPAWWRELETVPGIANWGKLLGKSGHHFMYWKSSLGCSWEKGTLHLQPPKV